MRAVAHQIKMDNSYILVKVVKTTMKNGSQANNFRLENDKH